MRLRRVRTLLIGLAMVLAIPFLETTKVAYAAADGCETGVESDLTVTDAATPWWPTRMPRSAACPRPAG